VASLCSFASKRKATGKKEMTVNENLCYINLLITVLHMIICIDPAGHADRIPYLLLNVIMSCIASLMVTIGILLVVSWVTIVEGGKSKKTPDWALKVRNVSLAAVYFFEPGFAIVECLVVPFEGGWSGPLNGIKGTIFASICCVWAVICWRFGSKIAGMLKSGGGAAATQAKAIKKFVNVAIFSFGIAVGYKFAFSLPGFFVGSAYDYVRARSGESAQATSRRSHVVMCGPFLTLNTSFSTAGVREQHLRHRACHVPSHSDWRARRPESRQRQKEGDAQRGHHHSQHDHIRVVSVSVRGRRGEGGGTYFV
jgi:hypothetical protein